MIALVVGVAEPAQACRYGGNQRWMMFDAIPTELRDADVVTVRVRIERFEPQAGADEQEVRGTECFACYAVGRVMAPAPGFALNDEVRIFSRPTAACGPAAVIGAEGLLLGEFRIGPDGVRALAPYSVSMADPVPRIRRVP